MNKKCYVYCIYVLWYDGFCVVFFIIIIVLFVEGGDFGLFYFLFMFVELFVLFVLGIIELLVFFFIIGVRGFVMVGFLCLFDVGRNFDVIIGILIFDGMMLFGNMVLLFDVMMLGMLLGMLLGW